MQMLKGAAVNMNKCFMSKGSKGVQFTMAGDIGTIIK